MFYTNYDDLQDQPYLYGNYENYKSYDNNDNQTILSFENSIFKEEKSYSFSLNSNDINDLYYIKTSSKLELEEIPEDMPEENISPKIPKEKNIPENPITKSKTTSYKTILQIVHKKIEKIFEIKKSKKSLLGRKRKNPLTTNTDNTIDNNNTHTKNRKDDIFTKLKRNTYNNSLKSVNYRLKKSKNKNLNSIKLKKIDNSVIIVSKKEENQALLKTELKDLFSNKISKKYKYDELDYNKKKIDYILKQNDKEINNALKKNFGDMMDIYVDKNKENIEGFTKLKNDKNFFEKNNDVEYIKLFNDFAKNYENMINKIFPRRKRKKLLGNGNN